MSTQRWKNLTPSDAIRSGFPSASQYICVTATFAELGMLTSLSVSIPSMDLNVLFLNAEPLEHIALVCVVHTGAPFTLLAPMGALSMKTPTPHTNFTFDGTDQGYDATMFVNNV